MQSRLTFEFIGNACGIFTGKKGTRILCDPWLIDGVFEGSWCHYPPLSTKPEDVRDVDALFVSHLHPDHFDERSFNFPHNIPIIVLDHGPNFLIKKLNQLGYENLVRIRDGETRGFREFDLTLYAPFAKHSFHEAKIGNLIDSAMLVACDGVTAFNANDNTPTVDAAGQLAERHGPIGLAMINYNAAGPYPACFENLTLAEKVAEHERVLDRNIDLMAAIAEAMQPRSLLPFAGAYVLGGKERHRNPYLGTCTWDHCAEELDRRGIGNVVLLREGDVFDVEAGTSNRPYRAIDEAKMTRYIEDRLSNLVYPYEEDATPDPDCLSRDLEIAAGRMKERAERFGLESSFSVLVRGRQVFPFFAASASREKVLKCRLDDRLLRRILNREAHWNNAEIGCHIEFTRTPNEYEPDLHTILQFLHL